VCDGVDNDGDGRVDDPFRDEDGWYVHSDHCGACNSPCVPSGAATAVRCQVTATGPECAAVTCSAGFAQADGHCVRRGLSLCRGCAGDADCGNYSAAVCADIAGEARCTVRCDDGSLCPTGTSCDGEVCRPDHGDCACVAGAFFALGCDIELDGGTCSGVAVCADGVLSDCFGSPEVCDGVDNDCNGVIDDPFVNDLGAYGVDVHHCGGCGIDCTGNPVPAVDLACGGPPSRPRCAMRCADIEDGLDIGDRIDADLLIENGCECTFAAREDEAGALDGGLDANCDGADGVVAESIYVAIDGSGTASGSPEDPRRSIAAAIAEAQASLSTATPRPHVFVAAGSYNEALHLVAGVHVHGGYAPDFRSRDPESYPTEIQPPAYEADTLGAGLVAIGIQTLTEVGGVRIRGASAPASGQAAVGAFIDGCGSALHILDSVIEAGEGADGIDGADGTPGDAAPGGGGAGDPPRVALEDAAFSCLPSNRVAGGAGQTHTCGGVDVSGGAGGSAQCAGTDAPQSAQEPGIAGWGSPSQPGGAGGSGGWDTVGPLSNSCGESVCCGLADFLVSSNHQNASDGEPGAAGADGAAGAGCADALGRFDAHAWVGGTTGDGTLGGPGSGGGGGGAGGSAAIEWHADDCEFADGLGGGGGGGGAGGCGGTGGAGGTAGSPSIGVRVVVRDTVFGAPALHGLRVITRSPGAGGWGGVGGNGALGGGGGPGGELAPEERTTPSLSGSSFGGGGGAGGPGGNGGGGGGGCGGSSVGIWLETPAPAPLIAAGYRGGNEFELAAPSDGGAGGGGSTTGGAGAPGEVRDVVAFP
jgi:hypothetical protein